MFACEQPNALGFSVASRECCVSQHFSVRSSTIILPFTMDNKSLYCRFVSRGFCREGNNCLFSHNSSESLEIPENVCLFNLQGKCAYGHQCRFDHWDATQIYANTSQQSDVFYGETAEDVSFIPSSHDSSYTTLSTESSPTSSSEFSASSSEDFVKSSKSYAEVCNEPTTMTKIDEERLKQLPLCPYAVVSDCPNRESCQYLHGELCDFCSRYCLHPYDEQQRKEHHEECVKEHEKQMELSFAIQRSLDKNCGICMDLVLEKELPERRFGILEKCNHIFCLSCIRKWRQTKQFDNRTIRACPECRVSSDFVVPSKYWIDSSEDKDKLINDYKKALSSKPCKYFNQGRGECPFAGACFYQHAYPDGRKADMPLPRPRRSRQNPDGELETLRDMLLWNYLEVRDDRQWLLTLDMDDLLDMREFGLFSESDDESDFESD